MFSHPRRWFCCFNFDLLNAYGKLGPATNYRLDEHCVFASVLPGTGCTSVTFSGSFDFFQYLKSEIVSENVSLVKFMCLVFTRMHSKSYRRRLRSLLLCLCDVCRVLIIVFV